MIGLTLASSSARGEAPSTLPAADTVVALIRRLGDADPSARDAAAAALKTMGNAARHELLAASRTDDPQIAPAAGEILAAIPWWIESDSAETRQLLEGYAARPPEQRAMLMDALARTARTEANDVLLRVASDDSSEEVAWHAASLLRRRADAKLWASVRSLDLANASPPILTLAARAYLANDAKAADELLRRVTDGPAPEGINGVGEWIDVASLLVGAAAYEGRWGDAIALQRGIVTRLESLHDTRPLVQRATRIHKLQLFMLHARGGPELGYADDAARWPDEARSVALYVWATWFERAGMTPIAELLARVASVRPMPETIEPSLIASALEWLEHDEWVDTELARAAARLDDRPVFEETTQAAYQLAQRHTDAGQWAAAVKLLDALQRASSSLADPDNIGSGVDDSALGCLRAWNQLRLCDAAGDLAGVEAELARLIPRMTNLRTDVPTYVVLYLRAHGRGREAEKVAEDHATMLRADVDAAPRSAKPLNSLAWFLSRTNAPGEEAVDASSRAIEIEPDNYAFLDTAADAAFTSGDAKRAVALETRALRIRPCDAFLKTQLTRFAARK